MASELSPRQAQILAFISRHCTETGYPPTVREIGLAVGLASPSTVHAHLAKLAEGGHITRDAAKPRAMLVTDDRAAARRSTRRRPGAQTRGREAARLPIVGAVAAGMPRLAEQEVEDWVETPFAADFLLRVTGESMRDAGILDGDLVAVRRQPTASNGEIVVAMVEDEATVKRFFIREGRVVLQPENDAFAPIVVDEVAILGKVVGVLRSL